MRLLLPCLFLIIAACASTPPPAPPPPPREPASLTVMSFNILVGDINDRGNNAWSRRRALVVDRIRAHDPDILALQEAYPFQVEELLAALPGYASLGVAPEEGMAEGEQVVILYRTSRLRPTRARAPAAPEPAHGDLWLSNPPPSQRAKSRPNHPGRFGAWARFLDVRTSRAFYIYNLHLDHVSQPARERCVALLANRIGNRASPDPVLVVGDLNAGENNAATRFLFGLKDRLDALGDNQPPPSPLLRDTFRVLHPDDDAVSTFNAFGGPTTGDKIDYVLVDRSWRVLAAAIDGERPGGRYPSDHFPVIATIRLDRADSPAEPAGR